MKYVILVALTLYIATKFGMDFDALVSATVNVISKIDAIVSEAAVK